MIQVPTIFLWATLVVVLTTGVAFSDEVAFFRVQDALDQVLAQLHSDRDDQPFAGRSIDAARTRSLRAVTFQLLASAGLDGLTPRGQILH